MKWESKNLPHSLRCSKAIAESIVENRTGVWMRTAPTSTWISVLGPQTVWEGVGGVALFWGVCHWSWALGLQSPGHLGWASLCLGLVGPMWALGPFCSAMCTCLLSHSLPWWSWINPLKLQLNSKLSPLKLKCFLSCLGHSISSQQYKSN